MSGQGNFFSELKRRNVYRVGVAYAVAAFMLLEVVSNAAPFLDLPLWVGRGLILLLVVGFPAALCFAWAYEITPEGLKRTEEIEHNASITHRTGHRLNIVIIVLLVALAGLYGFDRFLPARETVGSGTQTSAGGAPKGPAAENGISIAVLPFVNLSGDPSQEFFSDGMTEEITSALAKVKGLKVVGRTSAFKFKGQNDDLRSIGKTLSATNLLEGSVRKSGNRVRITGQLIRADDGTHIWTENYDRELTDIFATQDDIARAIATALQAPLGLKAGESLVASRDIEPENYQKLLHAKALYRARGGRESISTIQAARLLEEVTASAPGYAPAWSLLSLTYILSVQESDARRSGDQDAEKAVREELRPKAEAAARRALALDPRNADAHVGLGMSANNLRVREDFFKQALEIDPSNPEALHFYSIETAVVGRLKEALAMREKLRAIEPLVPIFNANMSSLLWLNGQNEAAFAMIKTLPGDMVDYSSGAVYALMAMGRYSAAAEILEEAAARIPSDADKIAMNNASRLKAAARILRRAPSSTRGEEMPELGGLSYVYLAVGAPERTAARLPKFGPSRAFYLHPSYAPVRKTAAFKAWAREIGLIDYWRARGWPDMCHPVGADDFECS